MEPARMARWMLTAGVVRVVFPRKTTPLPSTARVGASPERLETDGSGLKVLGSLSESAVRQRLEPADGSILFREQRTSRGPDLVERNRRDP